MPKTAQKGASVATVKKQGAVMKHIKKYWQWYAMMFIPIVYYIVFRYIPMFGNIIAFRRYRAGSSIFGDEWSGLKYFNQFMKDQNFWRAFKNTLLLNFKYLIISFPLTLIFALLLNEVKNVHFKKIVQTISYLPHFISMVIVAGMVREILSTSGPINNLITKLGGEAITFISLPECSRRSLLPRAYGGASAGAPFFTWLPCPASTPNCTRLLSWTAQTASSSACTLPSPPSCPPSPPCWF